MDQLNLTENVDTLFHSIENFTQREGVIGKAVTQSDKTFMPVVSITIGYGGGNTGTNKGHTSTASTSSSSSGVAGAIGSTGALGFGARLNTEAIIVIDNNNVSVLPMSTAGVGSMMDKIPKIISDVTQNKTSQTSSGSSSQSSTASNTAASSQSQSWGQGQQAQHTK